MKILPSEVRVGDLIAMRTTDPEENVGWLVTFCGPHGYSPGWRGHTTWIEFDAGTWEGHFNQPDTIPVWIVQRPNATIVDTPSTPDTPSLHVA